MVSFTYVLGLAAASLAVASPVAQDSKLQERQADNFGCPSFTHILSSDNPIACCVYGTAAVECCNLPGKVWYAESLSCSSEWYSSLEKWTKVWRCAQGYDKGDVCANVPKQPKKKTIWDQ